MATSAGSIPISATFNSSSLERDVLSALNRIQSKSTLKLNSRGFTEPLGKISGLANEFQKSLEASNARVVAFGASAGIIYNIQKAFSALIDTTIQTEKSLTSINVVLNASSSTLNKFGNELFNIAKLTGSSFTEVADAATEFSRQGLSLEDTLKRTRDALILTRLSGLDVVSSTEALTSAVNSFTKEALTTTDVVNKLAAVDAKFAVSSRDLSEAIKRVGSSASEAGVGFDELLGIVTSVQQTTARGGAVIGNALKTIFTRIQRPEVINDLRDFGVAVQDASGKALPVVQVLENLASSFEKLNPVVKAQVGELVGGVFQINILKASLSDLSKENSIFEAATRASTLAIDDAITKNEAYNKSISSLLNQTLVNFAQLGKNIGNVSVAPGIQKIIGQLNTYLEDINEKDGKSAGGKIASGLLKGITDFITGPGLFIGAAIFGKLFSRFGSFTTDAAKNLLGLNTLGQQQQVIQGEISKILSNNPALVGQILSGEKTRLEVEKQIRDILVEQSALARQIAETSVSSSANLTRGGLNVSEKGYIVRSAAKGYVPNFDASMVQEVTSARKLGARTSVAAQLSKGTINGKRFVKNNDEIEIVKAGKNGDSAVIPMYGGGMKKALKMIKSGQTGSILGGVKNKSYSRGFVPNFAEVGIADFRQWILANQSEDARWLKNNDPGFIKRFSDPDYYNENPERATRLLKLQNDYNVVRNANPPYEITKLKQFIERGSSSQRAESQTIKAAKPIPKDIEDDPTFMAAVLIAKADLNRAKFTEQDPALQEAIKSLDESRANERISRSYGSYYEKYGLNELKRIGYPNAAPAESFNLYGTPGTTDVDALDLDSQTFFEFKSGKDVEDQRGDLNEKFINVRTREGNFEKLFRAKEGKEWQTVAQDNNLGSDKPWTKNQSKFDELFKTYGKDRKSWQNVLVSNEYNAAVKPGNKALYLNPAERAEPTVYLNKKFQRTLNEKGELIGTKGETFDDPFSQSGQTYSEFLTAESERVKSRSNFYGFETTEKYREFVAAKLQAEKLQLSLGDVSERQKLSQEIAAKRGSATARPPVNWVWDSDLISGERYKDKFEKLQTNILNDKDIIKDILLGPAGVGKTTYASKLGYRPITDKVLEDISINKGDRVLLLSSSELTKENRLSNYLETILSASKSSGGKRWYANVANEVIQQRRQQRFSEKGTTRGLDAQLWTDEYKKLLESRNFTPLTLSEGFIPNFSPNTFAGIATKYGSEGYADKIRYFSLDNVLDYLTVDPNEINAAKTKEEKEKVIAKYISRLKFGKQKTSPAPISIGQTMVMKYGKKNTGEEAFYAVNVNRLNSSDSNKSLGFVPNFVHPNVELSDERQRMVLKLLNEDYSRPLQDIADNLNLAYPNRKQKFTKEQVRVLIAKTRTSLNRGKLKTPINTGAKERMDKLAFGGFIPNFASQNAIDAMREMIARAEGSTDPRLINEANVAKLKLKKLGHGLSGSGPKLDFIQDVMHYDMPELDIDEEFNNIAFSFTKGWGEEFIHDLPLNSLEQLILSLRQRNIEDLYIRNVRSAAIEKRLANLNLKKADTLSSGLQFWHLQRDEDNNKDEEYFKGFVPNFAHPNVELSEERQRMVLNLLKEDYSRPLQDIADNLNAAYPNRKEKFTKNQVRKIFGQLRRSFEQRKIKSPISTGAMERLKMISEGFIPNFASRKNNKIIQEDLGSGRTRLSTINGSTLTYRSDSENPEIEFEYVASNKRGEGALLVETLGSIGKRLNKPIKATEYLPQTDDIDRSIKEGNPPSSIEEVVALAFKQLRWGELGSAKNTLLTLTSDHEEYPIENKRVYTAVVRKLSELFRGDSDQLLQQIQKGNISIKDIKTTYNKGFIPNFADYHMTDVQTLKENSLGQMTVNPDTVLREALQNAFAHGQSGKTKGVIVYTPPSYTGDSDDFAVSDFGKGMSPKEVFTQFLPFSKTGNRTGNKGLSGYGQGKASMFLGSEKFFLDTVTEMNGKKVLTKVSGSPDSWQNLVMREDPIQLDDKFWDQPKGYLNLNGLRILWRELDEKRDRRNETLTGTTFAVKMPPPKNYRSIRPSNYSLYRSGKIAEIPFSSLPVFDDRTPLQEARKKRKNQYYIETSLNRFDSPLKTQVQDTISLPAGDIDLLWDSNSDPEALQFNGAHIPILSEGMKYSDMYIRDIDYIPKNTMLNVRSNVPPSSRDYPWNSTRSQLKGPIQAKVEETIKNLAAKIKDLQQNKTSNVPSYPIGNNLEFLDVSSSLPQEMIQKITGNNQFRNFGDVLKTVFDQISQTSSQKFNPLMSEASFRGLSIGAKWMGLNTASRESVKTKSIVDPFAHLSTVINRIDVLSKSKTKIGDNSQIDYSLFRDIYAREILDTVFHEAAHQVNRTEGEAHAKAMASVMISNAEKMNEYLNSLKSSLNDDFINFIIDTQLSAAPLIDTSKSEKFKEFFQKQNKVSGFVPNFAKKRLGGGFFGEFFKLRGSLGRKDFYDPKEETTKSNVANEFVAAQELGQMIEGGGLNPIFGTPTIYGSLSRSINTSQIYKSIAAGRTGKDIAEDLDTYTGERRGFERVLDSMLSRGQSQISRTGRMKALDLVGMPENVMLNEKAESILSKISTRKYDKLLRSINSKKTFEQAENQIDRIMSAIAKKGGQISLLDPGIFELGPSLAEKRTKALSALGYRDKFIHGSSLFNKGFIPNFAEGGFNLSTIRFLMKTAAKLSSSVISPKTLLNFASGKGKVEDLMDPLFKFLKNPSEVINSEQDLQNAKSLVKIIFGNEKTREMAASRLGPLLNEGSYQVEEQQKILKYKIDTGAYQHQEDMSYNDFLRYRLLGGQKEFEEFTLGSRSKPALVKNKDGSYRFNTKEGWANSQLKQIYTSASLAFNPLSTFAWNRKIGPEENVPGPNPFLGYTHKLGGFIGNLGRKGKAVRYEDRWDVDLHPTESNILNEFLKDHSQDLDARRIRANNRIEKEFLDRSYGGDINSLIAKELVSSIPGARPVVLKGIARIPKNERFKFSSGYVPNFSDPLQHAIFREVAAGYSPSQVKVGFSPSLVTDFNPSGAGVFNSTEGSLPAAMQLAKNAGIDVKTKGMSGTSAGHIPNFAEFDKFDTAILIASLAALGDRIRSVSEAIKNSKDSIAQNNKALAAEKETIKKASIEKLKANAEAVKNERAASADRVKALNDLIKAEKANISNIAVTRAKTGKPGAFAAEEVASKFKINQAQASIAQEQTSLVEFENKRKQEREDVRKSGREDIATKEAETAKLNSRRTRFGNFVTQQGLGIGLAVAGGANIAGQFMREENFKGRALASGIGDIASYAGTGAAFGPMGAAVGGVLGLASAAKKVYESKAEEALFNINKELDVLKDKGNIFGNAAQGYVSSLEQLQAALNDPKTRPDTLVRFQTSIRDFLYQIPDEFKQRVLNAGSDISKISEAIAKVNVELNKSQESLQAQANILELISQNKTFFGLGDVVLNPKKQEQLNRLFTRNINQNQVVEQFKTQGNFENFIKDIQDQLFETIISSIPTTDYESDFAAGPIGESASTTAQVINKQNLPQIRVQLEQAKIFYGDVASAFEEAAKSGTIESIKNLVDAINKTGVTAFKTKEEFKLLTAIQENNTKKNRESALQLKNLNDAYNNLNIQISQQISTEKERASTIRKINQIQAEGLISIQRARTKGALDQFSPFITEQQKLDVQNELDLNDIVAKQNSEIRNAINKTLDSFTNTITAQAEKITSQYLLEVSDQTLSENDITQQRNQFQRNLQQLTPLIKKGFVDIAQGGKITDIQQKLIEGINSLGLKTEEANALISKLQGDSSQLVSEIALIVAQGDIDKRIQEAQREYQRKNLELTQRLSFAGGAQALANTGGVGVSQLYDSISDLVSELRKTGAVGTISERGSSAFKLLDVLTNQLQLNRNNGLNNAQVSADLTPITATAIAGRVDQLRKTIDLSRRVTEIQLGKSTKGTALGAAFDTANEGAIQTALDQIVAEFKLQNMGSYLDVLQKEAALLNVLTKEQNKILEKLLPESLNDSFRTVITEQVGTKLDSLTRALADTVNTLASTTKSQVLNTEIRNLLPLTNVADRETILKSIKDKLTTFDVPTVLTEPNSPNIPEAEDPNASKRKIFIENEIKTLKQLQESRKLLTLNNITESGSLQYTRTGYMGNTEGVTSPELMIENYRQRLDDAKKIQKDTFDRYGTATNDEIQRLLTGYQNRLNLLIKPKQTNRPQLNAYEVFAQQANKTFNLSEDKQITSETVQLIVEKLKEAQMTSTLMSSGPKRENLPGNQYSNSLFYFPQSQTEPKNYVEELSTQSVRTPTVASLSESSDELKSAQEAVEEARKATNSINVRVEAMRNGFGDLGNLTTRINELLSDTNLDAKKQEELLALQVDLRKQLIERETKNAEYLYDLYYNKSYGETFFREERAAQANKLIEEKARSGIVDMGAIVRSGTAYNQADFAKDSGETLKIFVSDFKSGIGGAFSDAIKGVKNLRQAFADFFESLLNRLTDRAVNQLVDVAFGAAEKGFASYTKKGSSGGLMTSSGFVRGYNSGGLVAGGSGVRDDVLTMMNGGEFVIRKSSVNKYGSGFLEQLNQGAVPTRAAGGGSFTLGPLQNEFVYNDPERPTSGEYQVDPRLSAFALTDENNPQNKLREDRFEQLDRYLIDRAQFERDKQKALSDYEAKVKGIFTQGLITAGVQLASAGAQAGVNKLGTSSVSKSTVGQPYQSYNPLEPNYVGKKAYGGSIGKDNVPALLMGGEYVMNQQAVRTYGTNFMNQLNKGSLPRFADGGIVPNTNGTITTTTGADRNNSSNETLQDLLKAINALNDTISRDTNVSRSESGIVNNTQGNTSQTGGMSVVNNISVNVTPSETTSSVETNAQNNNQNSSTQNNDVQNSARLGELLKNKIVEVIAEQKRPGGLLYSSR